MNKIYITTLFLLLVTSLYPQQNVPEKALDKKLNDLLKASGAPGFAIAIVKGDQTVYSKGFGYRNLERNEKADENTLFAIGSNTKAFTTALLGIMEEEKGLKFEDSPKKYIPELEFFNDELNTGLSIKDLVAHRSGLPRHDLSWYLFPTEDKDSLLTRVQYQEPFAPMRTQWYYNNFGYLIQGMITEKLTGITWEENIRARFFEPLKMTRSNLTITELKAEDNIATGYEWKDLKSSEEMDYYNIAAISPAGSINSSVSEMANWLKVWLNNGKFENKQVLPEAYVMKAKNPLMLVGPGIADSKLPDQHLNSYGYAWFVSSYKGHYRMEHGGNIDGFSANACIFPEDDLAIVVLTNQNGSFVPPMARNIAADAMLELSGENWVNYMTEKLSEAKKAMKDSRKSAESGRIPNTSTSHALPEYTGTYSHPGYGKFIIELKNDSLFASFPVEKMYLDHWHYDVFKPYVMKNTKVDTTDALDIMFNFRSNAIGDIEGVSLKLEPMLDALEFERSPSEAKVDESLLETYTGNYTLAGTVIKISKKEKTLFLDVPGQPQYTLIPNASNEFSIKGLSGYKAKFEPNDENVMQLIMIQPNGTFTAVKTE